jgi:hypothetical protein
VLEGAATKLVTVLAAGQHPMHALYMKARGQGRLHGVCRACSLKMVVLEQVQAAGLPLLDDMNGHPGMGGYMERGDNVLAF